MSITKAQFMNLAEIRHTLFRWLISFISNYFLFISKFWVQILQNLLFITMHQQTYYIQSNLGWPHTFTFCSLFTNQFLIHTAENKLIPASIIGIFLFHTALSENRGYSKVKLKLYNSLPSSSFKTRKKIIQSIGH